MVSCLTTGLHVDDHSITFRAFPRPKFDHHLTIAHLLKHMSQNLQGALLCQKYAMLGTSVWICHLQRTWMNCWDRLKKHAMSREGVYKTIKAWFVRNPRSLFWPTEKPPCHFISWPVVAMAAVWCTLPRSQAPISWQDTDTGPISWQWKCLQKHSDCTRPMANT